MRRHQATIFLLLLSILCSSVFAAGRMSSFKLEKSIQKFFKTMKNIFTPKQTDFLTQYTSNNFNTDYYDNSEITDEEDSEDYVPVMELMYYGSWQSQNSSGSQQFDYFTQNTGYAEFTSMQDMSDQNSIDDNVVFWIYDGKYVDQKGASISFVYNNATDFDPDNSTFKNSNITFELYLFNNEDVVVHRDDCQGSYQLSIIDSLTNQPYQESLHDYDSAIAQFWINSTNCGISLSANVAVDDPENESQAMEYAIMVTLVCVAHLYGCVQIIRQISFNELDGSRYSLVTISIFTVWDVFLCIFHFYGALTTDVFFHYFITPAFWYFILASILEARLLLMVWKAKYYQQYQSMDELRNGLTYFYAKFYSFLAIALLLVYFALPSLWVFYLTSFFFVPQIVHNAIRGQRYRFDYCYVFMLGLPRVIIPLYVRGYADSMFKLSPSTNFDFYYPGLVMFQIFILYLQSKMGSRFLVPSCFLPPVHNYIVKIPYDTSVSSEDMEVCSICMDNLANDVNETHSTSLIPKVQSPFIKAMQTPCKHQFHEKCLKEWMEIKLECPFCRTVLPAID